METKPETKQEIETKPETTSQAMPKTTMGKIKAKLIALFNKLYGIMEGKFPKCFLLIAIGGIVPSVVDIGVTTILAAYYDQFTVSVIAVISDTEILIWTVYWLVKFRMKNKGLATYYLCNMAAMLLYCFVAVIFSFIVTVFPNEVLSVIYTFLFLNFKTMRFVTFSYSTGYAVGNVLSALLYSAFMLTVVAILPVIFNKKRILSHNKKKVNKKQMSKFQIKKFK